MPQHMERPTTHVTGAILFFGAVSSDVVIISAKQYKFVLCFIINSRLVISIIIPDNS